MENEQKKKISGIINDAEKTSKPLLDANGKEFIERFEKGSFKKAISNSPNIKMLFNHNADKVLASTEDGTLKLDEDETGKSTFEAELEGEKGEAIKNLIISEIANAISNGFIVKEQEWDLERTPPLRVIKDFELKEISIVDNPAYDSTSAEVKEERSVQLNNTIEYRAFNTKNTTVAIPQKEKVQIMDANTQPTIETNQVKESTQFYTDLVEKRAATLATGSAVVPEVVSNDIIREVETLSPVFQLAKKTKVKGALKVPKIYSEAEASAVAELEDIPVSEVGFGEVVLGTKRHGIDFELSQELLSNVADGIDLENEIRSLASAKLASKLEKEVFNGDGVKEYKGILKETGLKSLVLTGTEKDVELKDAVHRGILLLKAPYRKNAALFVSPNFYVNLATMKDTNGHNFIENDLFLGKYPIYETEALTDTNPLVIADMAQAYRIAEKKDIEIQYNDTDMALVRAGKVAIIATVIGDGAVVDPNAIVVATVTAG